MTPFIAATRTRELAINALRLSAQNNPYSVLSSYSNGITPSLREWHEYSYDLISCIEELSGEHHEKL